MLDATLTAQLKQYLELLREPIVLAASLDDSQKSSETRELLDEIAACSDKISVTEEPDGRTPSFAIRRAGTDIAVRFAGLPLGHEFTSLVLALLQVGGHPVKVDDATAAAVKALPPREFTTYMSLTCQNCPTVVQALNAMAVLNPGIKHTVVEGGVFQAEIAARNILAVPTVYSEGEPFASGRMDIPDFLAQLDTGAEARLADDLDAREPYEVLVVGGGPAGATAAIYSARKGIRTAVAADKFGGQVLDTMSIENFVTVAHTEGPRFAAQLEEHVAQHEAVDILKGVRATGLQPAGADGLFTVEFEGGGTLKGRSVIVSTGARWRTMGVPGEEEYRNKGVTFCPHCDGPLFKGKRIAVIGGGNSGIEAAIDLAGVVGHVSVLEFTDRLAADDVLLSKLASLPNVEVIRNAATTEVLGDGAQVTGLAYTDRTSGEAKQLDVNGVFVQIGLLPNTDWLGDALKLNDRKEVVVDSRGATSMRGVYAAGDCTDVPFKQILIAMGAGATASLSSFDHLIRASVLRAA
ncbi:MAG TPA: alkyl hydroperoxide reductase subunit F [Propionibacterium sp.]|nr:alkyl hydroperoxide reductase subunit F [Propionibacterium sp.]